MREDVNRICFQNQLAVVRFKIQLYLKSVFYDREEFVTPYL